MGPLGTEPSVAQWLGPGFPLRFSLGLNVLFLSGALVTASRCSAGLGRPAPESGSSIDDIGCIHRYLKRLISHSRKYKQNKVNITAVNLCCSQSYFTQYVGPSQKGRRWPFTRTRQSLLHDIARLMKCLIVSSFEAPASVPYFIFDTDWVVCRQLFSPSLLINKHQLFKDLNYKSISLFFRERLMDRCVFVTLH